MWVAIQNKKREISSSAPAQHSARRVERSAKLRLAFSPMLMLVPMLAALQSDVKWGTLRLNSTPTGPENLLPTFSYQYIDFEEFLGVSVEQKSWSVLHDRTSEACDENMPDDICTNEIGGGPSDDKYQTRFSNRYLPYMIKDQYSDAKTPTDVPVVTLESKTLIASITPEWGGKVWSVKHKASGKDMFFANPWHQPCNNGVLKAYTGGGMEFNWSPGQLGHTVFSEAPVYVARIPTPKGDIARVYEYDRYNGTAWQVDLFLDDETLWMRPTVFNPQGKEMPAYWWTNVGMATTTPNGPCKTKPTSTNANLGSRVLCPADYTIVADDTGFSGGGFQPSPWPHFEAIQDPGDPTFTGVGGVLRDYSYLKSFDMYMDNFLRITDSHHERPYIAWADDSIFGELNGVIHGHNMNSSKFWSQAQELTSAWTETHHWGGCFTELQTGVAPTQFQFFVLPAASGGKAATHSWTEYFKFLEGVTDNTKLYSTNYSEAIRAVDEWNDSPHGTSPAEFEEMTAFLDSHKNDAVTPSMLLHQGGGWGYLDQRARQALGGKGSPISPSLLFPPITNATKDYAKLRPWLELVDSGTFSSLSLAEQIPQSYQAGARPWDDLLTASAAKHGSTWLHELHLGTSAAERFDFSGAAARFTSSIKLKPTAVAHRNLATLATGYDGKRAEYEESWKLALACAASPSSCGVDADVASLFLKNLAAEITQVHLHYEDYQRLSAFLATVPAEFDHDLLARARVWDLIMAQQKFDEAKALMKSHFFVASGCPGYHRSFPAEQGGLVGLWYKIFYEEKKAQLGRDLYPIEQRDIRLANFPPDTVGWPNRERRATGWKGASSPWRRAR